jgi:hypothetical protein
MYVFLTTRSLLFARIFCIDANVWSTNETRLDLFECDTRYASLCKWLIKHLIGILHFLPSHLWPTLRHTECATTATTKVPFQIPTQLRHVTTLKDCYVSKRPVYIYCFSRYSEYQLSCDTSRPWRIVSFPKDRLTFIVYVYIFISYLQRELQENYHHLLLHFLLHTYLLHTHQRNMRLIEKYGEGKGSRWHRFASCVQVEIHITINGRHFCTPSNRFQMRDVNVERDFTPDVQKISAMPYLRNIRDFPQRLSDSSSIIDWRSERFATGHECEQISSITIPFIVLSQNELQRSSREHQHHWLRFSRRSEPASSDW